MSKEDSGAGPSRKHLSIPPSFVDINNKTTASTNVSTTTFNREYSRAKFAIYLEIGELAMQNEAHSKRLQNLRKELTFIKNTDWQYESPFGQS